MNIRSANNDDRDAVKALVFGVLEEYGLKNDPSGTDADLEDIEKNYITSGGMFEVVENEDGKIIGTVGLYPKGDGVCELRKMYLLPEARGRGLGKELMGRVFNNARTLGFRRIVLETSSKLIEAIGLYKRYGFKQIEDDRLSSRCDKAYGLDL